MLTPRTRRPAGPREFSHAAADPLPARDESGIRPPAELGDPTALCCAVAHAAIESLRGIRPLTQLARSVSPEIFDAL
ncbi:Rv3235 family protein, partial [Sanguibacter sp. 26GB23]|uniref:Rv3235 family protein n=1 Tax=Sanguibacter sp. 26GB23 TaxID=3156066 RepID=UPI0032AEB0F4